MEIQRVYAPNTWRGECAVCGELKEYSEIKLTKQEMEVFTHSDMHVNIHSASRNVWICSGCLETKGLYARGKKQKTNSLFSQVPDFAQQGTCGWCTKMIRELNEVALGDSRFTPWGGAQVQIIINVQICRECLQSRFDKWMHEEVENPEC